MATQGIYELTDTWTSPSTRYYAIKIDVMDTASSDDSLLLNMQIGGISKFTVDKSGAMTAFGGIQNTLLQDVGFEVSAHDASGSGTKTFDIEAGNYHTITTTGAFTVALTNPTESGNACIGYLHIVNGGAFTITWPGSVAWDGGSKPSLQTSGIDIIGLITIDGGATWLGFPVWQAA